MGLVYPVVPTGMVNVLLFFATHRMLPAKSVAPGWRGLFKLSGFTESKPGQDTERSFACRGTQGGVERKDLEKGFPEDGEPMSPRLQLRILGDRHGRQVRIKIDNHVDNTLGWGGNRSTAPNPGLVIPQKPLPALVREERKGSVVSEVSELTMVDEERWKETL